MVTSTKIDLENLESLPHLKENEWIHGRSGPVREVDDYSLLQLTKDWGVGYSYAGTRGEIWVIVPRGSAKIFDLEGDSTSDSRKLKKAIEEDVFKNTFPDTDINETSLIDDVVGEVFDCFVPKNIVDSAGAYDNFDWINWLLDQFNIDWVYLPGDTAVCINTATAEIKYRFTRENIEHLI